MPSSTALQRLVADADAVAWFGEFGEVEFGDDQGDRLLCTVDGARAASS